MGDLAFPSSFLFSHTGVWWPRVDMGTEFEVLPVLPPAAFSPSSWFPAEVLLRDQGTYGHSAFSPLLPWYISHRINKAFLSLLEWLLGLRCPTEAVVCEVWSLFHTYIIPSGLISGRENLQIGWIHLTQSPFSSDTDFLPKSFLLYPFCRGPCVDTTSPQKVRSHLHPFHVLLT